MAAPSRVTHGGAWPNGFWVFAGAAATTLKPKVSLAARLVTPPSVTQSGGQRFSTTPRRETSVVTINVQTAVWVKSDAARSFARDTAFVSPRASPLSLKSPIVFYIIGTAIAATTVEMPKTAITSRSEKPVCRSRVFARPVWRLNVWFTADSLTPWSAARGGP